MREGANDFHKYLLFSKLGSVDVYLFRQHE